jgi:hypothetical protein
MTPERSVYGVFRALREKIPYRSGRATAIPPETALIGVRRRPHVAIPLQPREVSLAGAALLRERRNKSHGGTH